MSAKSRYLAAIQSTSQEEEEEVVDVFHHTKKDIYNGSTDDFFSNSEFVTDFPGGTFPKAPSHFKVDRFHYNTTSEQEESHSPQSGYKHQWNTKGDVPSSKVSNMSALFASPPPPPPPPPRPRQDNTHQNSFPASFHNTDPMEESSVVTETQILPVENLHGNANWTLPPPPPPQDNNHANKSFTFEQSDNEDDDHMNEDDEDNEDDKKNDKKKKGFGLKKLIRRAVSKVVNLMILLD